MEKLKFQPTYTVADYRTWEGDWELWDGLPVSMSPSPGELHQLVAGNLFVQLKNQLDQHDGCRCRALYELDWEVDEENIRRPDIVVVCDRPIGKFLDYPPTLAVEVVSPSSARKDKIAKRFLYGQQGVKFFLLVDPEARSLEVLRLEAEGYAPTDFPLELHEGCTVQLDLARLWPDD
jgi:Uma2 family endonuclease